MHRQPTCRVTGRRSTLALSALLLSMPVLGSDATKEEAVAMVKRGVVAVSTAGADKAYAEFSNPAGKWVDRDLYLIVYRLDGTMLAHGVNAKQIGVNLIDRKDIDGKEFIRERMDIGKAKTAFWQDYKFLNPMTKKIESKSTYCEKQNDTLVCAGVYK